MVAGVECCHVGLYRRRQIKYLRVPDTLLDAVKEEQARAREAGRSARGAGPGPRGKHPFSTLCHVFFFLITILQLRLLPIAHHVSVRRTRSHVS